MFVSERLVFLELHKTGCTHIRKILQQEVGGELIGKHNQATQDLFTPDRKFLGSVRNPWDWYVSLWAYGCDKRGAIFNQATSELERVKIRKRRTTSQKFRRIFLGEIDEPKIWQAVYRNSSDPQAFQAWLSLVHNYRNREVLAEGYEYAKLANFAGFLTYRYLKLFCCRQGNNLSMQKVTSAGELLDFEESNCFVDYFIRNENLEGDLFAALDATGHKISDERKLELSLFPKTNISSRKRVVDDYYDKESLALIEEREQLLIRKFNYQSPDFPMNRD